MTAKRLTGRLVKLERRSAEVDERRERGMEWLRNLLADIDEREGPLPPRTTEDDRKYNEHMRWLARGNSELERDLHLWLKSIPE